MNITLTASNNIDTLLEQYNLTLWSKCQSYENIFIIEMDGVSVGYIAYNNSNQTITKFEIVEPYRNNGIGTIAMKKFLTMVRPYTNIVKLNPISDHLYNYYKIFGFKKKFMDKDTMIYKFKN